MTTSVAAGLGRRVVVGAVSGAVGTAAMDLLVYLRYRRDGGKDSLWRWESAGGVMSWNEASAPGRLGEKVARRVTGEPVPDDWARTMTNAVHWATGAGWGIQYALLAGRPSEHALGRALALGPVAWLSGYVVLPLAGLYKPIWQYDVRTLGQDLSAHVLYGSTTSAVHALLTRAPRS